MHETSKLTLGRIDRYIREWIEPAVIVEATPLDISVWEAPGEPVTFQEAAAADFHPTVAGTQWGKPWGTTWFHATGGAPNTLAAHGTRAEVLVNLGWIAQQPGFQAEGAAWDVNGNLVKGISPRNHFVPLSPVTRNGRIDFYIEAASNPDVPGGAWTQPTKMGDKATAGEDHLYRLEAVDLVVVDCETEALAADARTLRGLVDILPEDSPRRAEVIVALEEMCDVVDADNVVGTASEGRAKLAPALESPANRSAHEVYAVGHAHIDSAWLWPTRETERKVARTVANVLALMDENADFKYAFSSAQQYAWVKEKYPELYARLKQRIAEGRIIPVGGMWVESDTNMPGGEALVRQFVYGKGFFEREFGVDTTSVWLPDSFGYCGALPQIASLAGANDFLTQKLSWNDTNRVPHSTFWWEGLDGSRVFTHFPPVDTYNSDLSEEELARAERNFADKGHANRSLAPFGYGDGGGGPTREMIAQGLRAQDLEGSPKVIFSSPDDFFRDAREEYAEHAPTWVGEMYLEYHRGTYTSQQRTKRGNRRCEALLHEAELWAAMATIRVGAEYPYQALSAAWETVLLQQFHDILPGSSIAWVHREAERNYARVEEELQTLIQRSLSQLGAGEGAQSTRWANASPITQLGIPAFGIGQLQSGVPATVERASDNWVLSNQAAQVTVDSRGLFTSILDKRQGRELIAEGLPGNMLQMFRDIPNNWEAWDIERHYKRVGEGITAVEAIEPAQGPGGEPALSIRRKFSNSTVTQIVWMANGTDPTVHVETHVDWHEKQKLLKLSFPLDVVSNSSQSEMQFGYITRTTNDNTSWDAAQFETVAHRWVRVGEPAYAVVLANDATYGHDVTRIRAGNRAGTLLRASLLRAPLFPDPVADQGEHRFHHALTLGASVTDAYQHGYQLNLPVRPVEVAESATENLAPLVRVEGGVLVESIKLAEDQSGDLILRLYEPEGNQAHASLHLDFEHQGVEVVSLLESADKNPAAVDTQALTTVLTADEQSLRVNLRPFQLLTLRVRKPAVLAS